MAKKEIIPVEVQVNTSDANKNLNKTQDAIESVNKSGSKIKNLASGFGNLAKTIGGNVVKAFTSLKLAAAAVNFGAIIELVKKLYENWESIQKVITNFIPGFEKFMKLVKGFFQNFTDFLGLTSQAERDVEALAKANERLNEGIDDQIKLLQAVGGQEAKIYKLQKEKNENELKSLRERIRLTGNLTDEEQKRFREIKNEQAVLDLSEQRRQREVAAENAKKAEADRLARIEKEKKAREELYKEEDKATRTRTALRITAIDEENKKIEKDRTLLNLKLVEIDTSKGIEDLKNLQESFAAKKKAAEDEIALAEAKKQAEISNAQSALNIISGFVDQNSAAGKGIAVAQAIINTYQGASKAIAQGGIFGPVAAAATIAAGLIQVRNIVKTKVPSLGGGVVGDKGLQPIAQGTAPLQPSIQASLTQLDQGTVNRLGSASSRAYVVESDITSNQEKIKRINRAARLS